MNSGANDNNKPRDEDRRKPPGMAMGSSIGIGVAIGVALGLAMDNLALGIAIGVAIGSGIGAGLEQQSGTDGLVSDSLGRRTWTLILLGTLLLGVVAAVAVILVSRNV